MRRLLLLAALVSACATTDRHSVSADAVALDAAFPQSWFGTWSGEVVAHRPSGEPVRFQMKREIGPTDFAAQYEWTTHYSGSSGDQTREYTLLVRDGSRGEYAIDEHNDIVLDARYMDGTLFSWFEVRGNRLLVRERLERLPSGEEVLTFEIVSSSGPSTETGVAIPVRNYPVGSLQRAVLHRVEGED